MKTLQLHKVYWVSYPKFVHPPVHHNSTIPDTEDEPLLAHRVHRRALLERVHETEVKPEKLSDYDRLHNQHFEAIDKVCGYLIEHSAFVTDLHEKTRAKLEELISSWVESRVLGLQDSQAAPPYFGVALHGALYVLEFDPRHGEIAVSRQGEDYPFILSADRAIALGDLLTYLKMRKKQGNHVPSWEARMAEELSAYASQSLSLPVGVTDTMLRFLAHSVARGLWSPLAEHDARIPPLLVGYYLSEKSLTELGQQVSVNTSARASQLIYEGIEFLLHHLPDTWLQSVPGSPPREVSKDKEYPIDKLRRGRQGRGSEASSVSAYNRWNTADAETRARWLETIDKVTHSDEARDKVRQKMRAQRGALRQGH